MKEWKILAQVHKEDAQPIIDALSSKGITYKEVEEGAKGEIRLDVVQAHYQKAKDLLDELKKTKPEMFLRASGANKINTIAVPVDFSEYSEQIGKIAMRIGNRYEAKVWLIHSYAPPLVDTMAPEGYSTRIDVLMDDLNEAAASNMSELFESLQQFSDSHGFDHVFLDHMILSTTPEDMIRQTAEKIAPDLYIIGMRGGGEGKQTLLGSVAEKIIDRAEAPVLTIPLETHFKGLEYIDHIVYATNFDEADFQTIKKLTDLIKPFEPTIHCIHIQEEKESKWDEIKMYGLKSYFKEVYNYSNVQVKLIHSQEVLDGLNDYIKQENIGMVALTTHKRNIISRLFNPSITHAFLIHTHIPLLVFHA